VLLGREEETPLFPQVEQDLGVEEKERSLRTNRELGSNE
jgi:hypothetical protein